MQAAGIAPEPFVADLLSHRKRIEESNWDLEDGIKWAAGTMYGAGVETVSIACHIS